jgi:predicted ArsR family transcriptional regulator
MNQRLIAEIGRTQRLEILNSLKRTKGMSVNELVEKMNMSYMGIKQHCLTLQRDGYCGSGVAAEDGSSRNGLPAHAPHP